MNEIKQAYSYIEMVAECPYCGRINAVDWASESDNIFEKGTCEICLKNFKYCHPENNY